MKNHSPEHHDRLLLCFGRFWRTVLAAALVSPLLVSTFGNADTVKRTANNTVLNAGQIRWAAASHEHGVVLHDVVAFARNVARRLVAIGKPDPTHLAVS